jgi:predicted ribosome quality control (RQC) complex YloA/Tae2 family protein
MIEKVKTDLKIIEEKFKGYIESKQKSLENEENKEYSNVEKIDQFNNQIEVLENTLENLQNTIEELDNYE